ncbi:MAG: efflux transporter outer membrane subunit [Deltaproteobacteria bacterium]|uniref:Efflux transporter outer membrane subunit n=1 Tax=Candidatus Desulfacyla euxinica TaxID=2841693 RepID=A0A8J6MXG2_9DELT|nr:efflux transporter outer membrane subunit [Candidatus Desulfacyla euxinica]
MNVQHRTSNVQHRIRKTTFFSYFSGLSGFGILVFLIISGCAVGPDFKPPVVETPKNYRFEKVPVETMINLKWWELFNDPMLYSLVSQALENNKDLRIAAARVEQARAGLGFTQADQYPSITIQGGVGTGNFSGGARSDTRNYNYYVAPALSWELDFWGKFRRATESAKAELMASEYAHRTVQIGLISEVVGSYYVLLDFHQRVKISKDTLESRQESLIIIQKRFDRGIIPELDVNQAQIQKEIAAAAIPEYERSVSKTENVLSILLGKLPGAIKTGQDLNLETVPPEIPVGLPSNILERRPDIIQAMYVLEAQTANIGVAEAMRFPAISLTGLLGLATSQLGGITSQGGAWSVNGGLFGPIFEFYKNVRRVQIEEAKTKEALYSYENTVLTAFKEVEDALIEIDTYKKQMAAVKRKEKAAKNAYRLAKLRYDKGVSTYLEVLETERSLFSAELELSRLKQQYLNGYVKLYKALGGGWITEKDMNKETVKSAKKS